MINGIIVETGNPAFIIMKVENIGIKIKKITGNPNISITMVTVFIFHS
jgi:hypothetical protein